MSAPTRLAHTLKQADGTEVYLLNGDEGLSTWTDPSGGGQRPCKAGDYLSLYPDGVLSGRDPSLAPGSGEKAVRDGLLLTYTPGPDPGSYVLLIPVPK